MNMWITAAATTSPSAAHAIRQRLMNPPGAKAVLQITEIKQTEPPKAAFPVRMDADAHVRTWRDHLTTKSSSTRAVDYIKARCHQMGVSYEEIVGVSRLRKIVEPRQQLMCEVRAKYPLMSLPQMGNLFGGRDHTTIHAALTKHGHVSSSRGVVTPEMAAEMKQMFASGMMKRLIADKLGVSATTVTAHVDPDLHARQMAANRDRVRAARKRKRAERK